MNGNLGDQVDISHALTSTKFPNGHTQWSKIKAPTTDWAFNIVEDNHGWLTGTMIKPDGLPWNLKGKFLSTTYQTTMVSILPTILQPPTSTNGTSGEGLASMTATAGILDGTVKAGMDGAQYRGNAIMQNLILNSLVGTEVEEYIGKIDPLTDTD